MKYNDMTDEQKAESLWKDSDIKQLVYGYNSYSENDSGWWNDRLAWRDLCLNRIIKSLADKNLVISDDFFDDSCFEPVEGLIIKKDKETKKFEIIKDDYDLGLIMLRNEELRAAAQDDVFANALYASLCNVDWIKNGISWSCSWRCAGDYVAQIRLKNEDYIDFYCSGNEGVVNEKVAEILAKDGWTFKVD